MVEHLYVIGNGFDIFSGLNTRYSDFRKWLKFNYAFIYEALESAYGLPDIEWWNDFEVSLGKLDIPKYIKNNTPPAKSMETILKEIEEKREKEDRFSPSLIEMSPCADRLSGLFDVVHYCMKQWVKSMTSICNPKYLQLEKDNSIFLNFNYTRTLELLYEIPKERILHIHGCAQSSEDLVLGHNTIAVGDGRTFDEGKVCEALGRYHKSPYVYIFKNSEFFERLMEVKVVHIYGLSFSPVDIDYLDWIFKQTSSETKWEVSWYSAEVAKRIDDFVFEHWALKKRLKRIQLTPIQKSSSSSRLSQGREIC